MRPARYVGLALIASLACTAPAMAQGKKSGARSQNWAAAPVALMPEARFRLSSLLSVRTNIAVRESVPLAGVNDAGMERPALLALHSAILDLYPFGGGLRFSAGVGVDQAAETPLAAQGHDVDVRPTAAPAFTVGYGGSIKGPLNFAVDGGVRLHEVPRISEAASPRLTGNTGVDRAYPVVRFSLSRAF